MASDRGPAPGPLRWCWYAFGGRLPEQYREWVRHDLTAKGWLLRYGVRTVVRAAPLLIIGIVVLWLLPVPRWTVGVVPFMALLYVLYMTLTSAEEFRRVGLVQHGWSSKDIPEDQ